jgi:hypothetical protein
MQFSIWHWAILLLLIGAPLFFAVRSGRKPSRGSTDLVGFGGWLLLLAIGQTLSPLRTLAEFGSSIEGYQQLMTVPNGTLATYGEIALLLAFLVLELVVVIAMLRRSPRFKKLFLLQWIAIPVVFVVDIIWISALIKVPVSQILAGDTLVKPLVSFVVTGIWVAYVYNSVRVRNTFDRVAASADIATALQ